MKSTESKLKKKKGKIISPNRVWSKEAFDKTRAYQISYYKENYRSFNIRFSRKNDQELISYLESQDNLAEYIRKLVNKDIENKKRKQQRIKEKEESAKHG